ncbi:hypothetical protein JW960_09320 [candidate division KSB1 bacterium]|nr:hypothetical protein [candidate division KSB1 bacterium]
MKYWITLCLICLLAFGPVIVQAQIISARFNTTVYSWEQQLLNDETANHMRAYQVAQFSVAKFGVKGLSFHTYLNMSSDFAEKAVDDPRVWMYNCYLRYQAIKSLDVSVGRQRVYAGVGYGTIDGLQLKYIYQDWASLKVYAGTMAPLRDTFEIGDMNADELSWGFHLTTSKWKRIRAGLSFAQQSRVAVPYSKAGVFSGAYRLDQPVSALQRQLVGIDLKGIVTSNIKVQTRLDYNFSVHEIKRSDIGCTYQSTKFEVGVDYIYRTPYFDYNSIFWVFDVKPNTEIGLKGQYKWQAHRFHANVANISFDGESSQRLGIGWSWKTLFLGLHNRSGFGGDMTGLTASYQYPIQKILSLIVSGNLYNYKLYDGAESETAFAGTIGVNTRLGKRLSLLGQLHYLNNVYFSSDMRFFVQANYAFTFKN